MDFNEWKVLVKGLKSIYPESWFLPDGDSVKIWYQLLQDLEYKVVSAAIQKYALTNKKYPTVADIRECATSVSIGDKPLWSDGWEEVIMAIRRYGMYQEGLALEHMSEITRQAVQRLGFRNLCLSENVMADRANFRTIFEQIAERERTEQQMPLKLSNLIEDIRRKEQKLLEG
jgi:hypothetical protein